MHVIATAGHVDHGKSSLVRALTGVDPDRLGAERERGLSIELGYCSTRIEPIGDVAFVDVPGHERFISTMLAGIGPVPAVLFVVAADDPWMPQAEEHLLALDALGVTKGVLAITRSDLADPHRAREQANAALRGTTLEAMPAVAVSARTGAGLDELKSQLVEMLASSQTPDPACDVRLWIDRCFTIRGSGTIVTGTLPAGRISEGDLLESAAGPVRVRGMQALGQAVDHLDGPARVALKLSGEAVASLERGRVLLTPAAWHSSALVDVRIRPARAAGSHDAVVPKKPMLHVGALALPVNYRPLSAELGRVSLPQQLPLRIGDRAILRDPGSRQVWGISVLDPAPPALNRRGAAARRAIELAGLDGRADLAAEVARRGIVSAALLRQIGVRQPAADDQLLTAGGWIIAAERAAELGERAAQLVREHDRQFPLDPGVPVKVVAETLGLPSSELVTLIRPEPLRLTQGRLIGEALHTLPPQLEATLAELRRDFDDNPFAAPTAERLRELGLDNKALAVAEKHRRLIRLAPQVVLLPGADLAAIELLRELPQPFTTSQARQKLNTSRRIALPLLELLDKSGHTSRLPDDRRVIGP